MAFDDLDLEFEDEEEAKKKKSEAVVVDVDIEFSTHDTPTTKPQAVAGRTPVASAPRKPAAQSPPGVVKKLDDARAQAQARRPVAVASSPAQRVSGSNALKQDNYELESQEIIEMREQMRKVSFDADVKVAIAEFKMELLSELLSDTKLMQHQIEQLLIRINAKHPDMKNEVLMIKKVLADFSAKKRK